MTMVLTLAAAMLQPAAQPDLDWLGGYWLSCSDGREVSETWSTRRGGAMLGTNLTLAGDGSSSFEQMRIEFSGGTGEAHFTAQPAGQEPGRFRLVRHSSREAVFENPEHDFPQRIVYRRSGNRLTGRIEGSGGRSAEWQFRAAPLNARCRSRRVP
ncbi:MAG TPA: DUF6265 family protein [Allosphingosinicella sp.]|jgi:hypothetical protein